MYFAIDGNFVNNRKKKKSDPDDFPLTTGAAYFANEEETKRYLSNLGPFKLEVSVTTTRDANPPLTTSIALYLPQVRRDELCRPHGCGVRNRQSPLCPPYVCAALQYRGPAKG